LDGFLAYASEEIPAIWIIQCINTFIIRIRKYLPHSPSLRTHPLSSQSRELEEIRNSSSPDRQSLKDIRLSELREEISVREIVNGSWGNPIVRNLVVDNKISGRGIIDFSEYPSGYWVISDISYIDIREGNPLILRNVKINHSLFVDKSVLASQFDRIACEVNGKLFKIRTADYIEFWPTKKGWTYIRPSGVPWVPTLEPATYGAVFGAVGFGLTAWRKRRRLKGGQWF